MKIIFNTLTAIVVLTTQLSTAQDGINNPTKEPLKQGFGVHAGAVTGLGFSYRYFPEKWGVQITGIPIFGPETFFSSAGLSALYKIKSHKRVDLFTYIGVHHIHERYEYYYDIYPPSEQPEKFNNNILNVGFGAGVNIHLWDVLDLSLQTGYGVYNITNSPMSNITGEIGFYYRF